MRERERERETSKWEISVTNKIKLVRKESNCEITASTPTCTVVCGLVVSCHCWSLPLGSGQMVWV